MSKEFDPTHARAKGYTKDDWDAVDSPEATREELKQARPFSEAFPELTAKIRRGRPRAAHPKQTVSMRLDPDLLAALRATGKGWQTRVNDILRKEMGL